MTEADSLSIQNQECSRRIQRGVDHREECLLGRRGDSPWIGDIIGDACRVWSSSKVFTVSACMLPSKLNRSIRNQKLVNPLPVTVVSHGQLGDALPHLQ